MNYDFWLPAKSLMFDGTEAFLKNIRRAPPRKASIRSATTWVRSDTPMCR